MDSITAAAYYSRKNMQLYCLQNQLTRPLKKTNLPVTKINVVYGPSSSPVSAQVSFTLLSVSSKFMTTQCSLAREPPIAHRPAATETEARRRSVGGGGRRPEKRGCGGDDDKGRRGERIRSSSHHALAKVWLAGNNSFLKPDPTGILHRGWTR